MRLEPSVLNRSACTTTARIGGHSHHGEAAKHASSWQRSTAWHGTARRSMAQHSTAQHSTAQHDPIEAVPVA